MCGVCHKTGATDKPTIGPVLWGVGGRKAGSAPGYTYSPAMKASRIVWNRETLTAFIASPSKVVPGTKMTYAGQKNPKAEAEIIDYLLSLK